MTKGFCGSCHLPWDEPASHTCSIPETHMVVEVRGMDEKNMQETLPVKIMIWAFVIVCLWIAGLGLFALTQWVVKAMG